MWVKIIAGILIAAPFVGIGVVVLSHILGYEDDEENY